MSARGGRGSNQRWRRPFPSPRGDGCGQRRKKARPCCIRRVVLARPKYPPLYFPGLPALPGASRTAARESPTRLALALRSNIGVGIIQQAGTGRVGVSPRSRLPSPARPGREALADGGGPTVRALHRRRNSWRRPVLHFGSELQGEIGSPLPLTGSCNQPLWCARSLAASPKASNQFMAFRARRQQGADDVCPHDGGLANIGSSVWPRAYR